MDLQTLLASTVGGLEYELVDLEQSPRARLLRIFIDKPGKSGGVDVEDCTLVSNHVARVLAVEGVDYDRLEVSSPGLDRALTKAEDFSRFAGQEISLRLKVGIQGRRNFQGLLLGLQDGEIAVQIAGEVLSVNFENIGKARLVPKFD